MDVQRKKVGLVLSGGGAKGLAHIGVLRVLRANHIPIDYIVGTSMGALVAGLYAVEGDVEYPEKVYEQVDWKLLFGMVDPALRGGLVEGKKLEEWIGSWFEGVTFETLQVPLAIVATDLNTGEPVILKEGSVVQAIRASVAAPPTIKPITSSRDGKLLADGWLSNPLPADVAREMGADIVIGVVLDSRSSLEKLDENTISITSFLNRAFSIQSDKLIQYKLSDVDIVIRPQTGDIIVGGGFDEFVHKELTTKDIAAGEAAASEMITKIKKLL